MRKPAIQPGTALLRHPCATGSTGVDTIQVSSSSSVPAFRQLALAQLPASPRGHDEAALVIGAAAASQSAQVLDCVPVAWWESWVAKVRADLAKEHANSAQLNQVVRQWMAGAQAATPLAAFEAVLERLERAVSVPGDPGLSHEMRIPFLRGVFQGAVEARVSTSLLGCLLRPLPSKAAARAFQNGHFDACATWVEGQAAARRSVLPSVSSWMSTVAAVRGNLSQRATPDTPDDLMNDLDAEVSSDHRVLAQTLGPVAPLPALGRLALATLAATRRTSQGEHPARQSSAFRTLLLHWSRAAPWLGSEWTEAVSDLPVGLPELAALLFCRAPAYTRARLAAGIEGPLSEVGPQAQGASAFSGALRSALAMGWRPEEGFDPEVMAVVRSKGLLELLPPRVARQKQQQDPEMERAWQSLVLDSELFTPASSVRRPRL